MYDLYGVVSHRGSTWFGHYNSHVRAYRVPETQENEVEWRSCDDEQVDRETNTEAVVNRGAYLLFYRRRNTHNPIHLSLTEEDEDEDVDQEEDGGRSAARRRQLDAG